MSSYLFPLEKNARKLVIFRLIKYFRCISPETNEFCVFVFVYTFICIALNIWNLYEFGSSLKKNYKLFDY
jgi:hypothetical protein